MDKTNDATISFSGPSESRVTTVGDTRRRPFFLCNASGRVKWATVTILVGYLLGEGLDVAEQLWGRVGVLLVARSSQRSLCMVLTRR
jgi:hypothetical protein